MGECRLPVVRWYLYIVNAILLVVAVTFLVLGLCFWNDTSFPSTYAVLLSPALMPFGVLGILTAMSIGHQDKGFLSRARTIYFASAFILVVVAFLSVMRAQDFSTALQSSKPGRFGTPAMQHFFDILDDLYVVLGCRGGMANSTSIPISFEPITCKSGLSFTKPQRILNGHVIKEKVPFDDYKDCLTNRAYVPLEEAASNFTQIFCGSQSEVALFAQWYTSFFTGWAIALLFATLLILVSVVWVSAMKGKKEEDKTSNPKTELTEAQSQDKQDKPADSV